MSSYGAFFSTSCPAASCACATMAYWPIATESRSSRAAATYYTSQTCHRGRKKTPPSSSNAWQESISPYARSANVGTCKTSASSPNHRLRPQPDRREHPNDPRQYRITAQRPTLTGPATDQPVSRTGFDPAAPLCHAANRGLHRIKDPVRTHGSRRTATSTVGPPDSGTANGIQCP